jgi:hypothetical protein
VSDELTQLLEDPKLNISYNGSYYFFTYYNEKNRKYNITSHNKTSRLGVLLNTIANGKLPIYMEDKIIGAEESVSDAYSLSGIRVETDLIKIIDTVTKPNFGKLIMYGAKVHFARYPEDRKKLIQNAFAKISPPATSHFTPGIFNQQVPQRPGSDDSAIIADTPATPKLDMSAVFSAIKSSDTDEKSKLKKTTTVEKNYYRDTPAVDTPVIDDTAPYDPNRKEYESRWTYSTYYNSGYPIDTLTPSKPPFICVLDSEGPHTSLKNCLEEEGALETKYENKYNYKYLKYKIKYSNLKLLNK